MTVLNLNNASAHLGFKSCEHVQSGRNLVASPKYGLPLNSGLSSAEDKAQDRDTLKSSGTTLAGNCLLSGRSMVRIHQEAFCYHKGSQGFLEALFR